MTRGLFRAGAVREAAAFGVVFLAALFCAPAALFAHGVEVDRLSRAGTGAVETVRFAYTTGEPMMYAKIRLYPPSQPEVDIYQGLADRNGLFSFMPDEAGLWRVSAEDGMGHKGEITLETAGGGAGAGTAGGRGGKPPLPLAAVLGVSLLCNGFGVYYLIQKKREGGGGAH